MKTPDPRPWILQMQWKSEQEYQKFSYKSTNRPFRREWDNWTRKFRDPEHAKEMLTKDLKDSVYDFFQGRNWRIFNKETQAVLYVIIENDTITLI